MIGADAEIVDPSALRTQLRIHPLMQGLDIRHIVIASGNAGLVGHDENKISALLQQGDRLHRTVDPFDLIRAMRIAGVPV